MAEKVPDLTTKSQRSQFYFVGFVSLWLKNRETESRKNGFQFCRVFCIVFVWARRLFEVITQRRKRFSTIHTNCENRFRAIILKPWRAVEQRNFRMSERDEHPVNALSGCRDN